MTGIVRGLLRLRWFAAASAILRIGTLGARSLSKGLNQQSHILSGDTETAASPLTSVWLRLASTEDEIRCELFQRDAMYYPEFRDLHIPEMPKQLNRHGLGGDFPLAEFILEPEQQAFSIVALGDFNPAIFQPLWFSTNGLMPREETENAENMLIHKQIARFSMGSMQVHVDQSRLGITTVEPNDGPILRDLAYGTLALLEHTPLQAIGLNLDMEFRLQSEELWHDVGNRLVPKNDWRRVLESPGMRDVVVEGSRSECSADRIHFRIRPSAQFPWSVLVAVNQHYQLGTEDRQEVRERHREAVRILNDDWVSFCRYARESARIILQSNQTT